MKLGKDFVREITFNINNVPENEENALNKTLEDVTIDHEMDDIWIKEQEKKM